MISFEDIQIKYGNTIIIDHLDLKINTGEFLRFWGHRDAGKRQPCVRLPDSLHLPGVIYWWTERVS